MRIKYKKVKIPKYRNQKCEIDGIKFDSKKEGLRYSELKLLEKSGKIKDLLVQPEFPLIDEFYYKDELIRPAKYTADFEYIDLEKGIRVVEDVKSPSSKTEAYILRKKLFLQKYGHLYDFLEI